MPTLARKAERAASIPCVATPGVSRCNDVAGTCVYAIAHTPVRVWGIDAQTRLRRQVAQLPNLRWIDDLGEAGDAPVVIVRADYLFEVRTLQALAQQTDVALVCAVDARIAAVQVTRADRAQAQRWLADRDSAPPPALRTINTAALCHFDANLRRAEAPLLEPVCAGQQGNLEALLYGNAYKGITDLVTKWLWPTPARWAVRWCAERGVRPNAVTAFGLLLVLGAGVAFSQGHYLLGLAMGWLMTWLDTVDGKLARVTVQSSRLGHLLDHGVDLIHPPFWYLLWGVSLLNFQPVLGLDLTAINGLIIAGYVGGRVIEGIFEQLLGCSVFAWRPFDAWFRLVTARRNPALILLTASVMVGRPDFGLVAVALWTAFSTLVLLVRLLQGLVQRWRNGVLQSWLGDGKQAQQRYPLAWRTFSSTRAAYAGATSATSATRITSAKVQRLHDWLDQYSDGTGLAQDSNVAALLTVLKARFGDSLSAVLMYGSYLRGKRDTVLDFYVLLNDYRVLPWWQTLLCCIVSPNVYQIRVCADGKETRAKCAVLSLDCFAGAVQHDFHSYFWARFAQPSAMVYCHDQATRRRVAVALGNAAHTFIRRALPVLPARLSTHDLWAGALQHTYRSELRVEKAGGTVALVDAEPAYYQTITALLDIPALQPAAGGEPDQWATDFSAVERRRGAWEWRLRRIVGKGLTVLRVATAATMFEAPLDYVLWKIERHTGMQANPNALQRRWPLLFAWPLLWGLYRRGAFR